MSSRREDYIDLDKFYMAVALLAAKRSKDPVTQVGACVVNKKKRIVSIGYNGTPNGYNDNIFKWGKEGPLLNRKHLYVCHAEMNAIVSGNCADLEGCVIYVTLFPCNECTKILIQAGIKKVVYLSDQKADKEETIASKLMLDTVNIPYVKYETTESTLTIDFESDTSAPAPSTSKKRKR